jgi:GntR family transcriptional regulator
MITVTLHSTVPLQEQLVAELKRLLATGKLRLGDELPPVRQLAADLGINWNTVARAYRELTESGLLASSRGRGTVVIATVERSRGKPSEEKKRIEQVLAAALAEAKLAGLEEAEARAMLEHQLDRIWKSP